MYPSLGCGYEDLSENTPKCAFCFSDGGGDFHGYEINRVQILIIYVLSDWILLDLLPFSLQRGSFYF